MSVSSAPAPVNPSPAANRYPPAVLARGYTPAPNLVRRAWPALGATYAAYFLYETIISYQRGAAPPAVYVDQLAAELAVDPRRIREHTAQLVGLGLLIVGRALDGRNLYDFRPLYARVAAWAASPPPRPRLRVGGAQRRRFPSGEADGNQPPTKRTLRILDSIRYPLPPTASAMRAATRTPAAARTPNARPSPRRSPPGGRPSTTRPHMRPRPPWSPQGRLPLLRKFYRKLA